MDFLDFISNHVNKERDSSDSSSDHEPPQEKKPSVEQVQPEDAQKDCKHDEVLGDPSQGGICMLCNKILSAKEMGQSDFR